MKVLLRSLQNAYTDDPRGAIHFENRCRMSLVAEQGDVDVDMVAEQAAFQATLEQVFNDWSLARGYEVIRVDHHPASFIGDVSAT